MKMKNKYVASGASGYGLATVAENGVVLDSWFAEITLHSVSDKMETRYLSASEARVRYGLDTPEFDDLRRVKRVVIQTVIGDLRQPPKNIHDLYLRLHLLSQRLITPWQANLDGFLELLIDVAWTPLGPCLPSRMKEIHLAAKLRGEIPLQHNVFKLPRMQDYVPLTDVYVVDPGKVMLGAYLAPGTFVSPAGFCNMNSGTLGPCMVEGRISLGATVKEGTHIGGGASVMGSTSGGGKHVVVIGENCLLGANSGVGISLGDNCVVEAGLYVTAGLPVTRDDGTRVKAIALAGLPDVLYRRNAASGTVEAVHWTGGNKHLLSVLHRSGNSATCVPDI